MFYAQVKQEKPDFCLPANWTRNDRKILVKMALLHKKWFSRLLGTPRQHFHATNPINQNLPKMTQNDPLTKNALLPYGKPLGKY